MTRSGHFRQMFDLPIGSEMVIEPGPDEPVEKALKRIKVRASKYRKEDRSYIVTLAGNSVRVKRVPFGKNKKLSSWESMLPGEVLILDARPTKLSVRSAKNTEAYINKKCVGHWDVSLDDEGRLSVKCIVDSNNRSIFDELKAQAPPELTEEERALRSARLFRLSAANERYEATRVNPAMAKILREIADKFEARAERLETFASGLNTEIT